MRVSKLFLLTLLVFLAAGVLSAQITGDLRGVVLDSSGAAVPNAKVSLKNLETGESRSAVVSQEGVFSFSLLRIGQYEIRAEAPGFRVALAQAEIKTGEVASARFVLEVGSVSETVTVTDAVQQLDTENAQIQTSVVGQTIQELPVARNPNLFALTAPGVAPVSANNPFLGSGSFNSNGGRGRGNNITVDGITATDVSVTGTGGTLNPLNFSSIKEVKVITNNFSAEYGRNSSSQVLYITKNGTNELHGELFEYFRNDKLNARPFFDRSGRTNIIRRNEYGWSLGGPVYIPKFLDLRNKLFWHSDYQGVKARGAGATRIARVPTPEQAAGITDPSARALFQQYQVPTDPSGQIQTSAANKTDFWQYAFRFDANISSRDTVWFRYSNVESIVASDGLTFIGTNLPGFGATNQGRPRQSTAAYTRLIGNTMVNEFRFGFGQSDAGFPIDTPFPLGPRITFQDGSVNSFGVWEGLPQGREQKTYQFNNNFSMVQGKHYLKFGGEYYYLQADSVFDALFRPLLAFANFRDFQNGVPAVFQQRFGNSVRNNRVKNLFLFAQDDWKVSRNLTINAGVRFEFAGGPREANRMISNLNLDFRGPFEGAGAGPLGRLETGFPSFYDNYNWAPRIGFAWNPGQSGRTVIRGGYGISYDFIFLNPITNQRFLPPFIVAGVQSGQASFTGDNSLARILAGTATIQTSTAATAGRFSPTAVNFGGISPAIDQNLNNPLVHQWNIGIQREQLGVVWKASYVGTKGNFLLRSRDINFIAAPPAPAASLDDETARLSQWQSAFSLQNGNVARVSNRIDPRYNGVIYVDNSADSNYHSFQFEAQKRLSNTLMMNANWTWSKTIDDGSDVLGVLINDAATQQDPRNNRDNRAAAQFDLRHRLVISHVWEPQWFKGSGNWALKNVIGNWGFTGISSFRTGFPVTLDAGARRGISPLTVIGGGGQVRPNVTGPVNFDPRPAGSAGAPFGLTSGLVTNYSAYAQSLGLSQPLLGNFGNFGRNMLRLNGERNFDWNVYKNFNVSESVRFQIRAEFYNIFNNTSFQEVSRTITAPDFGQYTAVGQNARLIQLGARFVF